MLSCGTKKIRTPSAVLYCAVLLMQHRAQQCSSSTMLYDIHGRHTDIILRPSDLLIVVVEKAARRESSLGGPPRIILDVTPILCYSRLVVPCLTCCRDLVAAYGWLF